MSHWNHSYELGLAHGAIHDFAIAAIALDSACNRIAKAERLGVLRNSDRLRIRVDLEKVVAAATELLGISQTRSPVNLVPELVQEMAAAE